MSFLPARAPDPMDAFRIEFQAFGQALLDVNWVPLAFAVLLGGIIGFERELSGRPAGLRTHILVCLCSTLVIAMSRHAATAVAELPEAARIVFDPNRMGAGIVTGIGFLGAATVIRSADLLRGLTTAACIWFVAGLGIVLGLGYYAEGTVATVVVLLVLTVVNKLAGWIQPVVYRRLIIEVACEHAGALATNMSAALKQHRIKVLDMGATQETERDRTELVFFLRMKNALQAPHIVAHAAREEGVLRARWALIR